MILNIDIKLSNHNTTQDQIGNRSWCYTDNVYAEESHWAKTWNAPVSIILNETKQIGNVSITYWFSGKKSGMHPTKTSLITGIAVKHDKQEQHDHH